MNVQGMALPQHGLQSLSNNKTNQTSVNSGKKEFLIEHPRKDSIKSTKDTLDKMFEEIQSVKDKMDFDLTVDNILQYKKVVKNFLQYYTAHAMDTKDIPFRNGKHQENLTIVKKVDEGIKELDDAMSLLDTKSGHLNMLKRIGEINGMILHLKL